MLDINELIFILTHITSYIKHIQTLQYNETFKALYDNAPKIDPKLIDGIFLDEFHQLPSEIFQEFDYEPIASASIAQVPIYRYI